MRVSVLPHPCLYLFGDANAWDFGCSNRCTVISCFILQFPNDIWCRTFFHILFTINVSSFKVSAITFWLGGGVDLVSQYFFAFRFQERCFAAHSGSWFSFCRHTHSRVLQKSDLSQVSAEPRGPVFQFTALQPSVPVFRISVKVRGLNWGPWAAREGFYGFRTIYMWLFWAHLNFKWLNSLGNRVPLETEACLLHGSVEVPLLRKRLFVCLAFTWTIDPITTAAFLTLRSGR